MPPAPIHDFRGLSKNACSRRWERSANGCRQVHLNSAACTPEQQQIGFEDHQIAFEDHQIGFEDLQIGFEDLQIGFEDHQTGFEALQIGIEDLQIGFEVIQTRRADLERPGENTNSERRGGTGSAR